jgi:ribose-phosphate pyrophosphokinase
MEGMAIFTGNSNPVLAKKICEYLSLPLGAAEVKTFSDGEIQIEITENVRLKDVFVLQSTCSPVNDNLVELLLMIDAFKRSSARRITVVIPYFGYARQKSRTQSTDQCQTGCRYDNPCRCQSRHYHGLTCRPDPGIFQHSGGQPVRGTGSH